MPGSMGAGAVVKKLPNTVVLLWSAAIRSPDDA
jgi:hypothetical protein